MEFLREYVMMDHITNAKQVERYSNVKKSIVWIND